MPTRSTITRTASSMFMLNRLSHSELAGRRRRKIAVEAHKLSHSELPYKLSFPDTLWSP
jgi:hypothetical protein